MIVRPVRADSRAASRISITMTLFSSDERPEGLNLPRATPARYEIESASCGCNGGGVRVWSTGLCYGRADSEVSKEPGRPHFCSVIVRPVRADSRAASRISITIEVVLERREAGGLELAASHADQIRNGIGVRRLQVRQRARLFGRAPGRRTRKLSPPVAMA